MKKKNINKILIKLQTMLTMKLFTKEENKWSMNLKRIFMKILLKLWKRNIDKLSENKI